MAKIETYSLAQSPISGSDKLIGTDSQDNNATKNFTINELIAFIDDSNMYVPYTGASFDVNLNNRQIYNANAIASNILQSNVLVTTPNINITTKITLNANAGTAGQVLTSQGNSLPPIWTTNTGSGAQGIQGPAGPAGPAGPVGPAGLNWQGAWSALGTYVVDDAVGYGGASWFCISNIGPSVTTPDLDTTHWALLAAQGATGPTGATGAQGPTGATGPQGASGNNTLQQVLTNSTSLTNGRNFQGTGAGVGNLGFNINGFGTNCSINNSGTNINAFGTDAASSNTGNDVNAIGNEAAFNNTGNGVNAFGYNAGYNNTFSNVNLFGYFATATANDQLAMSNDAGFKARISYINLTADRLYELPNTSGTIALTSQLGLPYKVYAAIVKYASTPIITVLQNTLGVTINFIDQSFGASIIASSAAFTVDKTVVVATPYRSFSGSFSYNNIGLRSNDTQIDLLSVNTATAATAKDLNNPFFLEIRVYP